MDDVTRVYSIDTVKLHCI